MICRLCVPCDDWLSDKYLILIEYEDNGGDGFQQKFGLVTQVFTRSADTRSADRSIEIHAQFSVDVKPKVKGVFLRYVTYLSNYLRKWNGLVGLFKNKLIKDILNPRGGDYFCKISDDEYNSNTQVSKYFISPTLPLSFFSYYYYYYYHFIVVWCILQPLTVSSY